MDQQRRIAIQPRLDILVPGAEFKPRHILHAQHAAILIGANDDGAKFIGGNQAPGGGDIELIGRVLAHGLRAHAPKRRHLVLLLDCANHIGRGQAKCDQPIGLEPDAHGIVARAEHLRITHTRHAAQSIQHIDGDVIAEKQGIKRTISGPDGDHLQHGG